MEERKDILDEPEQPIRKHDELNTGLKVLSFCIPIAGAIIYFTTDKSLPNRRKQACQFALIGMAVGIVLRVLLELAAGS